MHLARDMGVPLSRARQWLRRDFLPPWYWPHLVDVVEQRFQRTITYRQLVEAAAKQRGQGLIHGQLKAVDTKRLKREGEERGEAA